MNDSELQIQAQEILDTIAFMPFEQCQPLTHGFESIPARPGIYAIRHRTNELLYIGKTKSLLRYNVYCCLTGTLGCSNYRSRQL